MWKALASKSLNSRLAVEYTSLNLNSCRQFASCLSVLSGAPRDIEQEGVGDLGKQIQHNSFVAVLHLIVESIEYHGFVSV